MKVLVTGGLGSLGLAATHALLAQGHAVRCLDLPGRRTRARARALAGQVDVVWGDVRDPASVRAAVADCEAVIHCAAVLFPDSEDRPPSSEAVNVGGTRSVLAVLEDLPRPPVLVFPSSISVYGKGRTEGPLRRVDDPVNPSTHYAKHKVECEEMIRASTVPWTILRVGAAIEAGLSAKLTLRAVLAMLDVSPAIRIEWVDPRDVGLAMANAALRPEARSRILLIAGGPACRATQRDFFAIALEAVGLPAPPDHLYGRDGFEMDWMETAESQALLAYQHHTWADFAAEFRARMRPYRMALAPIRPLARRGLLLALSARRRGASPRSDHGPRA